MYAKVCIQLDVSKPFIEKLWIGTSDDYGWEISLEYEGNHAYCSYYGLLGHTLGLCRKKREEQGKDVASDGQVRIPSNNIQRTGKTGNREHWLAKHKKPELITAREKLQKNGMVLVM